MTTIKPVQNIVDQLVANYADSVSDLIIMRDRMIENYDNANGFQKSRISQCIANFNAAISTILNPDNIDALALRHDTLVFLTTQDKAWECFDTGNGVIPCDVSNALKAVKALEV